MTGDSLVLYNFVFELIKSVLIIKAFFIYISHLFKYVLHMKMHRQYNFYFIFDDVGLLYEYHEPYTFLNRVDSVVFNHQSKQTEITTYIDISVDRKGGMSKICSSDIFSKENYCSGFPLIAASMPGKVKKGSKRT